MFSAPAYTFSTGEAGVLVNACTIPASVSERFSGLPCCPEGTELEQLRSDVWYASEPIAPHKDPTEHGPQDENGILTLYREGDEVRAGIARGCVIEKLHAETCRCHACEGFA